MKTFDEREMKIMNRTMAFASIVTLIANIAAYGYSQFRDIKVNLESFTLLNLLLFVLSMYVYNLIIGGGMYLDYEFYKGELPLGISRADRLIRTKYYIKESFIPSLIFTFISIKRDSIWTGLIDNRVLAMGVELIFRILIFSIFNYIFGELGLKIYKKKLKELEWI